MEKELESRMDKLGMRYRQAAATVELLRPVTLPSKKSWSRTQVRLVDSLGALRESRKPVASALVKQAYVRGLRSVNPGASLTEEQENEVNHLSLQLDYSLSRVEQQVLRACREHVRKLRLADTMEKQGVPEVMVDACVASGAPFPLEQRARARVRAMVEAASVAGALAGTPPAGYDGAQDAA